MQETAECRIEFDENQSRGRDAGLDQSFGDRPGPRSKLNDRPVAMRIDIPRHGAREHLARRRHRTHRQRPLEPGADEAHFVIKPNAALAFELPDLFFDFLFDFLADAVALALEQSDLAPDIALNNSFFQFE